MSVATEAPTPVWAKPDALLLAVALSWVTVVVACTVTAPVARPVENDAAAGGDLGLAIWRRGY